jgi:hypothetical protein
MTICFSQLKSLCAIAGNGRGVRAGLLATMKRFRDEVLARV